MKQMIHVLCKCFLFASSLLIFTGCNSLEPFYDELLPIPQYPRNEKQYNTSAIIRLLPSKFKEADQILQDNFTQSGYADSRSTNNTSNFFLHIPEKLKIVTILDLHTKTLQQKEGKYLETRIIVMIRKPGYISGSEVQLNSDAVRYFQAYDRTLLAYNSPEQNDYRRGTMNTIANLFTIDEFRTALEPVQKDKGPMHFVQRVENCPADICWKNSRAEEQNGNFFESIFWAYKSACLGNKDAISFFAYSPHYTNYIVNDYAQRLEFARIIAKSGTSDAQNKLGNILLNSPNQAESQEAITWFKKAAAQNSSKAFYKLGHCYEKGLGGVTINVTTALQYYQRAADLGLNIAREKIKALSPESE